LQTFAQGLGQRSEEVLRTLRHEIERGVYALGTRLPTEKELCQRFEASRPTIRRAVARLVDEGKLRVRRGSGMYVTYEADAAPRSQTISLMYIFEGQDLTHAQDYALSHGYLLCIFSQARDHWDVAAERKFLQRVLRENHSGLLAFCSPLEPRNDELLEELEASGIRVIHIEHYRRELPSQGYVLPDYRRAGHMAAVRMMLAGYESIVLVSCNVTSPYSGLIEEGFAEALDEHRHGYDPQRDRFVLPQGQDPGPRRHLCDFLAGRRGDLGVVCESAGIGGYVLTAAAETRRRVPEEVGVVAVSPIDRRRREATPDVFRFDRMAILRQALDEVARPGPSRICRLVRPELVPNGTTRAPAGSGTSQT